jgi:hypothetical protein
LSGEYRNIHLEIFSQEYNFDVNDFEQPFKLQTKIIDTIIIDPNDIESWKNRPTQQVITKLNPNEIKLADHYLRNPFNE